MRDLSLLRWPALGLIAGLVAGCGESTTAPQDGLLPSFAVGDVASATLTRGEIRVCKYGSSASFDVEAPTGNTSVDLADGECKTVAEHLGAVLTATVTESSAAGMSVDSIVVRHGVATSGATFPTTTDVTTYTDGRSSVDALYGLEHGTVIEFYNSFSPANGRMTGGGRQIRVDGVRITRGLTIHCDITLSNNLEINWTGGNHWHIDKPLTSALCVDDPNVSPVPPDAPFDTFIGEATGELNGVSGSVVWFTFVDQGEPGDNDTAWIRIWAPGDTPLSDPPVLDVSGTLDGGNLQAHYDQPHG